MHKKQILKSVSKKKGWSKRLSRNKISDRNQTRIIGVQKKNKLSDCTQTTGVHKKKIIGLQELYIRFYKTQTHSITASSTGFVASVEANSDSDSHSLPSADSHSLPSSDSYSPREYAFWRGPAKTGEF